MTRLLTAAAMGALLLGSATTYAAVPMKTTLISHPTSSSSTVNYGQRCSSLAGQWQTAVDGHGTSPNIGKARADAAKGEKLCKSTTAAQQKRGVRDYEAALKMLGVTPA